MQMIYNHQYFNSQNESENAPARIRNYTYPKPDIPVRMRAHLELPLFENERSYHKR